MSRRFDVEVEWGGRYMCGVGCWVELGAEGCGGPVFLFGHCSGFPRLWVLARWVEVHVGFLVSLLNFVIVCWN